MSLSSKYQEIKRIRTELNVLRIIRNPQFGYKQNQIKVVEYNPDGKTEFKERKNYGYFYYYIGPLDEKTRDFCKQLLIIDKIFSLADIEALSRKAGYDVFKHEGSHNCRHQWIKFLGEIVSTPPPTDNQINKVARKSIYY